LFEKPVTGFTPNILVVEDDRFVRELVEIYLVASGYRVTGVANGAAMRQALAAEVPDLVIMDLKLPGEDGLSLTRYLRENYQLGIVILTTRNDALDRVAGLDCGADDYVTKPFDQRELLARIRSVLRRVPAQDQVLPQSRAGSTKEVSFHGFRLDIVGNTLVSPSGANIELTDNEAKLLMLLAGNADRIMSRDLLMDLVLKRQRDPMDRSIDVLVTRVRRKIDIEPGRASLIKTVRGAGYMLQARQANSQARAN
jgi:DNA-binding response OmpR family regulator